MHKTWLSSMLNLAIHKISMGQTNTHTHTQNDYCNPRCACAPRVNYCLSVKRTQYYTYMIILLKICYTAPQFKMRAHTCKHTHTYTHMHTHMHTHTHTHVTPSPPYTHTHTHKQTLSSTHSHLIPLLLARPSTETPSLQHETSSATMAERHHIRQQRKYRQHDQIRP